MHGREVRTGYCALRRTEENRAVEGKGIHDGTEVRCPIVHVEMTDDGVREPCPAPIEEHQAAK